MYERFVLSLKEKCEMCEGYDIYLLRRYIIRFCNERKISYNTASWLYTIDYVWCNLPDIEKNFKNEEDFESWVSYEM